MPLNARLFAIRVALISFFILGLVGSAVGLSPFTACTRAFAGALLAYIAANLTVKAINAILMDAMITKQLDREKEPEYDAEY